MVHLLHLFWFAHASRILAFVPFSARRRNSNSNKLPSSSGAAHFVWRPVISFPPHMSLFLHDGVIFAVAVSRGFLHAPVRVARRRGRMDSERGRRAPKNRKCINAGTCRECQALRPPAMNDAQPRVEETQGGGGAPQGRQEHTE